MNKEQNEKIFKDIITHLEKKFIQSGNEQENDRCAEKYRRLPLD